MPKMIWEYVHMRDEIKARIDNSKRMIAWYEDALAHNPSFEYDDPIEPETASWMKDSTILSPQNADFSMKSYDVVDKMQEYLDALELQRKMLAKYCTNLQFMYADSNKRDEI